MFLYLRIDVFAVKSTDVILDLWIFWVAYALPATVPGPFDAA